MGRPRLDIDPNQVRRMAAVGMTVAEMAVVIGCSKDTLERRFAALIEKGRERGKCSLRRMQWKSAKGGNVTMQIWLGKQMLGQTDKVEGRYGGTNDGQPIEVTVTHKFNHARYSELFRRCAIEGSDGRGLAAADRN